MAEKPKLETESKKPAEKPVSLHGRPYEEVVGDLLKVPASKSHQKPGSANKGGRT